MDGHNTNLVYIFMFTIISVILPQSLGANLLVVFPHISYNHFKATSKLVEALAIKGHNVSVVSPYEIEVKGCKNITNISIEGIVDPIKSVRDNFFENLNNPESYWSKLQYAKKIGSEYAVHVLNNENVTKLTKSNSFFDSVLIEDVSADALTIFSYIFKCPLVVLLSEPVSLFYDNYFFDNGLWRKRNELRNAHHYAIKELYREWIVLPEQNKIIKGIFPTAPDIREVLYNTSLVFIPSYHTFGTLVPKYLNVKQIGGFQFDNQTLGTSCEKIKDSKENVVISENFKGTKLENVLQKILWRSNISVDDILGKPNVKMFIGNGDIYDISYAIGCGVPVLNVFYNKWFQQFLTETLIENKVGLEVAANRFEIKDIQAVITKLFLNNSRFQEQAQLASEIIRAKEMYPPIDEAVFWIEYVIQFEGAPHLRPHDLRSQLNRHLIEIIIVLVIIDIVLFLIFYWIISHVPRLIFLPNTVQNMVHNLLSRRNNNNYRTNISYIKI